MPSRSSAPRSASNPAPASSAILHLSSLSALLAQLTSAEGSPHTALLCHPSGAIIASSSVPTTAPWPPRAVDERQEVEGEREGELHRRRTSGRVEEDEALRTMAAVGCSTWEEERAEGAQVELVLETWVGRIEIAKVSSVLLILVGHHLAPWPVIHKKLTAAVEVLKEPLSKVTL